MSLTEVIAPSISSDLKDGIVKTELFDVDMANQLLGGTVLSQEEQKKLKAYMGRREASRQVKVTYVLGKKTKTDVIGRLCAKGGIGLQTLPRELRAALAKPYYWDIDMKNAQPTLLLQLAKQKGWEHTQLERFVNTREETLKETQEELGCTRAEAKDRYIQLFFGSSFIHGLPQWVATGLYPELCKMKANIYSSNLELAKKLGKEENSVMSYVLQTIERECLLSMDRTLSKKGRSMDVYIHDGGLVRKLEGETEFPVNLMKELEYAIYKDTNFRVSLAQKPIETSYVCEESDFTIHPENAIIDDLFAARAFVELNKENLLYSQRNIYVFNEATGIWSSDEEQLNLKLTNAGESLIFRKHSPMGITIYNYSGTVKNRENLKKLLPSVLEPNDQFLEEGRKKACFKLLFKNGIYDFATQTFTKSFDRSIVFSFAVPRDFVEDVPQEDLDFVNNTFFVAPFANLDTPRVFRHYLMRGLVGDYRMKKFLAALGDANSSKGTMTVMCQYTFGTNATTFNANNLLLRKHQGDSEREYSWVGGICNSRLAFSNEIKNEDGIKIDGNMLKTITGGGDEIVMRRLYKESEKIMNYAMPILFAQDLPDITPPDAINNRIVVIQYDYSFMENPNPNRPTEKQADTQIKDKLCCEKYANAFTWLMIQEYNNWMDMEFAEPHIPEFMMRDRETIAPTSNIREILEGEFELTGNEEDFLPYADIKDVLKKAGVTMKDARLGKELTRLGLEILIKKVNRKSVSGRTGIKWVSSLEEE